MIGRRASLLFLAAAVLAACPVLAQDRPASRPGGVEAPEPGKGQIVFYRRGGQTGMLLNIEIREDGRPVAKLTHGVFVILPVEPGAHTYTIQGEAQDSLTLEIDADETYYVEQSIGMGVIGSRPRLGPVTQEDFKRQLLRRAPLFPVKKR